MLGPRRMRVAAVIFAVLAVLAIGFMAVGFFLPGEWSAERTRQLEAPAERVYERVAGAREWTRWAPWPDGGTEFHGPETGAGSARTWSDPEMGSGRFEIVEVDPDRRVAYRVELEEAGYQVDGLLELEPVDGATRVRWREQGDFGRNPVLAFTARRMEEIQAQQMDYALDALAELVEEGGP